MEELENKNIILGITGSIAAYKAAEIARLLKKEKARVYPVMTKSATYFIHPLTLQAICQEKVITDLFEDRERPLKHISLSLVADALLVAPATANFIGKVASGVADDALTTFVMATATRAPIVIAPAMNKLMYENPLVQKNIEKLKSLGYTFIGPEEGELACGKGKGRMSEPSFIVDFLKKLLSKMQDLKGKSLMVTAGPTREPFDMVRFFSNYSSGKMGFAIAEEARRRGAEVTLISGPTFLEPPPGVRFYSVETCLDMREKVMEQFEKVDAVIMAAAVSDFRPANFFRKKIKKEENERLNVELVKNPDILQELGKIKGEKILVGFCAESDKLLERAKEKLRRKNLDLIVANNIREEGAGFEVDTNKVFLVDSEGNVTPLPLMSKKEVAAEILNYLKKILDKKGKR